MENINENPDQPDNIDKKIAAGKDDATAGFANAEKESAAEINRAGDANSRHYMNKDGEDKQGPDWDKKSKSADGDTSPTAGVFK